MTRQHTERKGNHVVRVIQNAASGRWVVVLGVVVLGCVQTTVSHVLEAEEGQEAMELANYLLNEAA